MTNEPEVLLVDEHDNVISTMRKEQAHIEGKLHRAFSIFLINKESGKLLLQQRSIKKYHSGGLWSNSCCSHQYNGEKLYESLIRCIQTELGNGININNIKEIGTFTYYSDYGMIKEHEIDHVFVYVADDSMCKHIVPNKMEIDNIKWLNLKEVESIYNERKSEFTSWFYEAYTLLKKDYNFTQFI